MSELVTLLEKKLAREIKAREQAEQLLEEKTDELYDTLLNISQNRALLQTALSSMQEGFLLTETTGKILLFNQQLKNTFADFAPSIHVGMNINNFFFAFTEHPAYLSMLDEGVSQCSFEIKLSDGRVVAVAVKQNEDDVVASTHRDITKEKALIAEQQKTILKLVQAQKMESIGKMASSVAHDFNNVIAAIKGYASFLQEDIESSQVPTEAATTLQDSVSKIQQAAHRAEDMVKQILGYSNHVKPEFETVFVHDMIKESINLIQPNLPDHIHIDCSGSSSQQLQTQGQATQLTQVMLNIINNAINAIGKNPGKIRIDYEQVDQIDLNQPNYKIQQFMPKDAHVAVAGLHVFTEPCIKINVFDDGPGMSQNIIEQLFDMFFTTRNANKGTGLGMYGVATIITDHMGGIKVYSKFGHGTYIEIILPLSTATASQQPQNSKPEHTQNVQLNQVLVIDDNQEVGLMLSEILSRKGIHSKYTDSPQAGLQQILKYPKRWQAIISDQKMPELTGLDILQTIRAQGIKTPFILTSGYIEEYQDVAAFKLADHLIPKPIDTKQLSAILSTYFP